MIRFSIVLICTFATHSFASTHPFLKDAEAVVVINGNEGDEDALNLFESMKVAAIDTGDKLQKSIDFALSSGEKLLSVSCTLSKLVASVGSCNVTVYKTRYSHIDAEKRQILAAVYDREARELVKSFNSDTLDHSGKIFNSDDDRLGFYVDRHNGIVDTFRIFYME